MPKETEAKRQDRRALYEAYQASGQNLSEFSRERGISYWRAKAAIRKTEAERSAGAEFQELALPTGHGAEYTVKLRSGREIRLPPYFSEKRVRQLVEILEAC
jgi:hypothetical protein